MGPGRTAATLTAVADDRSWDPPPSSNGVRRSFKVRLLQSRIQMAGASTSPPHAGVQKVRPVPVGRLLPRPKTRVADPLRHDMIRCVSQLTVDTSIPSKGFET